MEAIFFVLMAALIPLTTKAASDVALNEKGIPVKVVNVEQFENRAPGALDLGTAKGVVTQVKIEVDTCRKVTDKDFAVASKERDDLQILEIKADPAVVASNQACKGPKKRQTVSLNTEPISSRKPTLVLNPSLG